MKKPRRGLSAREQAGLMGMMVVVKAVVNRKSEINNRVETRTWIKIGIEPRTGWIVGFRTLFNGTYNPGGSSSFCGPDDYEGPYLAVDNSVPVVMVAYWPSMKPVPVPLDGWLAHSVGDPLPRFNFCPWGKKDKEALRRAMEGCPRDGRGRWMK